MNIIARRSLRPSAAVPMSSALEAAVRSRTESVHRYSSRASEEAPLTIVVGRMPPDDELIAEARATLERVKPSGEPVDRSTAREWLMFLNHGVRNPQSYEDFEARLSAIATGLADMPVGAFTLETARVVSTSPQCDFWPSVATLHALLLPFVTKIHARIAALREIATWQPRSAERGAGGEVASKDGHCPPRTTEECEYVRAAVQGLDDEFARRRAAAPADRSVDAHRSVRSRPLNGAALAALRADNPLIEATRAMQRAASDGNSASKEPI